MEYKYKVGDLVVIRKDLNENDRYYMRSGRHANIQWMAATNDMCDRGGQICHIKFPSISDCYKLLEDPNDWDWTDEMFEDVSDSECLCASLL